MKIYVMRHGQTDWNLAGKAQGRTDIELNDTGIEQAKQAKKQIDNYKIDLIICSPLKRARKTAEIINEAINCQIISDERIIERGFGNIEGKTDEILAGLAVYISKLKDNGISKEIIQEVVDLALKDKKEKRAETILDTDKVKIQKFDLNNMSKEEAKDLITKEILKMFN